MPLTLCVLLWAKPGHEDELTDYEDAVLALLARHGGSVVSRVRSITATEAPTEVQVLELVDEAALESFMADPERLALGLLRDRSVARTQIIPVTPVTPS